MFLHTSWTALCFLTSSIHFLSGAPSGVPDVYTTISPLVNCSTSTVSGVVEFGCWGYVRCISGVAIKHFCPEGHVFERDSMTCVHLGTGHTDCHKNVTCQDKESGFYADLGDDCQTYTTCLGGKNMGRQYCPANLVFNQTIQICDYPYNVEPPCGTKTVI